MFGSDGKSLAKRSRHERKKLGTAWSLNAMASPLSPHRVGRVLLTLFDYGAHSTQKW